ncbi:Cytochrome c oxidase subunit 8A [Channa argus]|uniref:Cytochrome c oxidase subunit 8A n=1 Tax=Channa argus TaxID=215402 RepID=A0A6G1PTL4_CHAAH|nr:Cytochrome c oxidase subunit 8A [Channa argus]
MPGFLRTVATRVALTVRGHTIIQRANLQTRPARERIGPVETVVAFTMFSLALLGPSGWILAHLEDYKKKE